MKLIHIDSYHSQKDNKKVGFINQRVEYFHHYWNFVLTEKSRWIFFTHEKLESHRSLFTKINIQLSENIERYPKRLRALVVNHPYFSSHNILIRNSPSIQKRINSFIQNFNTMMGKSGHDHGAQHLALFKNDLSKIERTIIGKATTTYFQKILAAVIELIHTPDCLSATCKEDIHFLVNSMIVELYHFGYSSAYIKKVLDIILFPRKHIFDFPFRKNRSDFKSPEDLNKYTESILDSLTLRTQFQSLFELVSRRKLKGYYIFKINNFNFFEHDPLKIWDVTFYNPQLTKQLSYGEMKDYKEYVEEMEKYFEQFIKKEEHEQFKSTCNAIISTEYRPLYFNNPDQSIFKAIEKVSGALSVLKHYKHLHVGGHSFTASIDLKTVIITHENGAYHAAPFVVHDYNDDKPFELNADAKESIEDNLKWVNKLNPNNVFHKKIIDISFAINRYRYNPLSFSFRDFWITVADALFPNDSEKFFEFSYACVELYLRDQMMTNLKIFLHDSLKKTPTSAGYYTLTEQQIKNLGLEIQLYKSIKARKFSKRYAEIKRYHNFEFLNDLVKEADKFITTPDKYFAEIKKRLHSVIYEIFAERNLEVHNNLFTDFSLIKLREFCVSLAVIMRLVISQRINSHTKTINDLRII